MHHAFPYRQRFDHGTVVQRTAASLKKRHAAALTQMPNCPFIADVGFVPLRGQETNRCRSFLTPDNSTIWHGQRWPASGAYPLLDLTARTTGSKAGGSSALICEVGQVSLVEFQNVGGENRTGKTVAAQNVIGERFLLESYLDGEEAVTGGHLSADGCVLESARIGADFFRRDLPDSVCLVKDI